MSLYSLIFLFNIFINSNIADFESMQKDQVFAANEITESAYNNNIKEAEAAAKVANKNIASSSKIEKIANSENAKIEDNLLCFIAASKVEEEFGIEKHLLSTIASVESGQWDYKREQFMAWPWTVNAQGKGYYLKTKEEAVAKVKELQEQGVESIDVGCMQINLKYHHDAFTSLEDAFDPQKNIEYGAKFLRKLYSSRGKDWNRAVMAYHSKDPVRGKNYKLKLNSRYEQLKVALNSKDMSLF